MPTKKTTKSDSKNYRVSEKKEKDLIKKVVVKRRKVELVPTKASAVAIVSQANRAQKQALIKKVAMSKDFSWKNWQESKDTKIPVWVWIFFGCSLMLFCVSCYKAYFYPQITGSNVADIDVVRVVENQDVVENDDSFVDSQDIFQDDNKEEIVVDEIETKVPETATEVIEQYFARLSNRQFEDALGLMVPSLRSYPDIRDHFTSYRMNPFLDGIEWWQLIPKNFRYVNSPSYWRDLYNFDLSYLMISDQTQYDETWEITVNTSLDEPKISSIRCISNRCSFHPIFWPEKFGLM